MSTRLNINYNLIIMKADGGYNQSQKFYHCEVCGGIARGNRFVNEHLLKECDGIQKRKTKKSTQENQHRLEEAKINTELWFREQQEKALYKDYKEAKARILESIEQIRMEFGTSYQTSLEEYYRQIF